MRAIDNVKLGTKRLATIQKSEGRHYHNYIPIDRYRAKFGKTPVNIVIKQCECGKVSKQIRPANRSTRVKEDAIENYYRI